MLIETIYPDLELSFETTAEDIQNFLFKKVENALNTTISVEINSIDNEEHLVCFNTPYDFDFLNFVDNNPPQCISYIKHFHYGTGIEDTNLYCFTLDESETSKLYKHIFEITKKHLIGYTLYLHYNNVTYQHNIGFHLLFKKRDMTHEEYDDEDDDDDDEEYDFYERSAFNDKQSEVGRVIETHLLDNNLIQLGMMDKEIMQVIKKHYKEYDCLNEISSHGLYNEQEFLELLHVYCSFGVQNRKCDLLFEQVKDNQDVLMAKNPAQRLILAERLFSKDELKFIDSKYIADMLLRAKHYYEINFIPQKVKELAEQKLSQKAIAEQLHISIAKVKAHLPSKK